MLIQAYCNMTSVHNRVRDITELHNIFTCNVEVVSTNKLIQLIDYILQKGKCKLYANDNIKHKFACIDS